MSLTPQQLAKIHHKEAALSDALRRDPLVNYYEGWFFVTLNTMTEAPVLSVCVGSPSVPDSQQDAPHCEYTELGEKVKECWMHIPDYNPNVTIDACEVMPEHFHGLLYMKNMSNHHLGRVVNGFMIGCTHAYWDTLGINWRSMKSSATSGSTSIHTGAIAQNNGYRGRNDPQWQDHDHTRSYRGPALFTRGYNDVEPLTMEQVEIKRTYIRDQARKRLIQGDRHECFRKNMNGHSANWTLDRVRNAIAADRFFHYNLDKCLLAQQRVEARLNTDSQGVCLAYLGNRTIMSAPRKLPLVCHRDDAWQFDKQKAAVLAAARNKAVIVSAFISPKEREIREQLMIEVLPFIEIMDNGFSDRYKPVGKAFYVVAENRMVQISPWKYVYQKDVAVSREMCLVMNELARVISGQNDDWWKDKN